MKAKLRHPVRAIREPFGTAGLIVACIALIAALGGTALAAKGALSGKQKKEVEKIAKKFAGKPGAPGAEGKLGPQGAPGTPGKDGTNGTPGTNGKSVIVTPVASGEPECAENGGAIVEAEGEPSSATEICNGEEGSPWSAGGFLPSEKSLKGHWGSTSYALGAFKGGALAAVSYLLPVQGSLTTHYVTQAKNEEIENGTATAPTGCGGSAANPSAVKGNLCVFATTEADTTASITGSDSIGFTVGGFASGEGIISIGGTWAATSP